MIEVASRNKASFFLHIDDKFVKNFLIRSKLVFNSFLILFKYVVVHIVIVYMYNFVSADMYIGTYAQVSVILFLK